MQQTTKDQMLFIAELNGFKEGTLEAKLDYGIDCYANHKVHTLDLTEEEDRADNYENIWLERIYIELDEVHEAYDPLTRKMSIELEQYADSIKWSVPLELDASASMLQYEGALLGDDRLLRMTNCIVGEEGLTDPWGTIPGVPRLAVKKVFTPKLYGSYADSKILLQNSKKFEEEQIKEYLPLIKKEEQNGAFGIADTLKSFIIDNCKPKAAMEVHIWNEKFTVECNSFTNIGEYSKYYRAFDSVTNSVKDFKNTHTKRVPDLERFRLYFVTLLV